MADNVIVGLEKIKGMGLEWRREGTMERWNEGRDDGTMERWNDGKMNVIDRDWNGGNKAVWPITSPWGWRK